MWAHHKIGMRLLSSLFLISALVACSDDGIDSNEEARRAYLGLDTSIEAAITLGFVGFNTASSANISPQMATGIEAGTLTVTGQVDQGTSANKGMRLNIGMVAYTDGPFVIDANGNTNTIIYDTDLDPTLQPFLSMQLKNIPTGTLEGTLTGTYVMTGDIEGSAELNLTFTGALMDGGNDTVLRVPGSTLITGTVVTPDDGTFEVDVTL
jgi:hypothetical protein